jgi:SAM-dependent methyltransferase
MIGDRIMHAITLRHGKIKFIDQLFGVYRFGTPGSHVASGISSLGNLITAMRVVAQLVDEKYVDRVHFEIKGCEAQLKIVTDKTSKAHTCIMCQKSFASFIPYMDYHACKLGQKYDCVGSDPDNFACPNCWSLDRERHLLLYLIKNKSFDRMNERTKVLHIAPEPTLRHMLAESVGTYIGGDLLPNPQNAVYVSKMSVLDLPFKDECFDIIICNHVLEHIEDDMSGMRELRRVLKKDGYAILQTPFSQRLEKSLEQLPEVKTDADRYRVYGQADHVRIYGLDFFTRLTQAGFRVEPIRHKAFFSEQETVLYGVNPKEDLVLCFRGSAE